MQQTKKLQSKCHSLSVASALERNVPALFDIQDDLAFAVAAISQDVLAMLVRRDPLDRLYEPAVRTPDKSLSVY